MKQPFIKNEQFGEEGDRRGDESIKEYLKGRLGMTKDQLRQTKVQIFLVAKK